MTREEKVNLLNELLEIEEKNDIGNLTSTDRREFQQWVEDLEQEPKTGHWRKNENKNWWWYECDQCGSEPLKNDCQYELSPYCPNCGCCMVEPQESEESD